MTSSKLNISFPKGTFVIAFMFTLFNIGLGTIYSLLVLYVNHNLNFSHSQAYYLWGTFFALFFSSSLAGGYLGGKLGNYCAMIVGLSFAAAGFFTLATQSVITLYAGLACFIAGSGLFVPNALFTLGQLFAPDSNQRHSAFTILFVLSNIGVIIASLGNTLIAHNFGYNVAFIVAGTSILLCLIIFINYLYFNGLTSQVDVKKLLITAACGMCIAILTGLMLANPTYSDELILVVSSILAVVIIKIALQLRNQQRQRFLLCMLLLLVSMAFWIMSAISPSVLTLFISQHVNRSLFGYQIPAATYFSLSPFFIITIAPIISLLWLHLKRKHKDLKTPVKLAFGIIFMGLAYIILAAGTYIAHASLVATIWIVFCYLFQTLGEIFTAPITQSMIGETVPKKYEAFIQGTRDFIIGISGVLAGFLAQNTIVSAKNTSSTNTIFSRHFIIYGGLTFIIGLMVLIISYFTTRYNAHAQE